MRIKPILILPSNYNLSVMDENGNWVKIKNMKSFKFKTKEIVKIWTSKTTWYFKEI